MAAKKKIAPPKPDMTLPWSELTRAQQNQLYTKALHAYGKGEGPNPSTSGAFDREKRKGEADAASAKTA